MFDYVRKFENLKNLQTAIYCYNQMVSSLRFYNLEQICPEKYESWEEKKTDEEKMAYLENICSYILKENTGEIERTRLPYYDEANKVLKQVYELIKIIRVTDNLFYRQDAPWAKAE